MLRSSQPILAPRRSSASADGTGRAKAPVSVIVPVKNEADNLRRCLPALAWADEVFVVDSQSTDQTAHRRGRVRRQRRSVPLQRDLSQEEELGPRSICRFRNDWVLIVDADEVVGPELAAEIAARGSQAGQADGYYLNSQYYFLGRQIRHCGYSSCWNLRLFKHRLGRYEKMPDQTGGRAGDNEAHEHVELDGRVPYDLTMCSSTTPIRRSPSGSRSTTATRSGRLPLPSGC